MKVCGNAMVVGQTKSLSSRIFDVFNVTLMLLLGFICLYPMLHVFFGSLSDPRELFSHRGLILWPQGWFTEGYRIVFNNPNIWMGYKNTLFYVIVGTAMRTFMTMLGAYVLYQKSFMPRRILMLLFVFTMYVSGGLIPGYLLINKLELLNTPWAIIVPSLIGTWNMIILRTAFAATPDSLEESARLDGAGDLTVLFRILMPTNIASIMVIVMYYAVGEWNSWFSAAIYLPLRRDLHPLQLFLREILIFFSDSGTGDLGSNSGQAQDLGAIGALIDDIVRYCTIIVATVPILAIYPFVQKYFVKGVMMGSMKG